MTFLVDLIVVLLCGAMAAGLAVRLWAGTGPFAWGLRIATLWALWTGLGSAVLYLSHRLELSVRRGEAHPGLASQSAHTPGRTLTPEQNQKLAANVAGDQVAQHDNRYIIAF